MPTVKVGEIDLYFERHGSGEPLLLVAGYGGVGSYWKPQIEAFSRHFEVVLHDHRGTGQSTHDTAIAYSVDQMAKDVIGLMDALEIDKAHYVGHSLGGAIGQVLGVEHGERFHDLVIYASFTKSDEWLDRCMEIRRTLLVTAGERAFVRATPTFLYPSWWINENATSLAEIEAATLARFPPIDVVASRTDAVVAFDRRSDLHRIKVPTLLLCAKDDILTPPYYTDELSQLISDAKVFWLEKGGHACSQTVPRAFNAAVLRFLRGQI